MSDLAPSLLAADFYNLENQLCILRDNNIEYLHLDVMDGNYVPNISFGPGVIKCIRNKTDFVFDVHLMIDKPEKYIEEFVKAGADIITIHAESTIHHHRVIQLIKSFGIKAGISLNPATPINILDYILEDLDLILIMSVNPGFGGQSFIPSMEKKLKEVRCLIDSKKPEIILEVDGGVKLSNLEHVISLGVDLVVSGSDVFVADLDKRLKEYNKIMK